VVSVLERTREFGVMMALGFAPARLAWLVTLEAVLASSGGFVLGTVIGYALLFWMQQVNVLGPFFSNFVGSFLAGLAVGNDIRTEVRAEYLIYAGATVALAALFAVLTPARTVRTLVPAEAMRSSE
jgi:ABC-type antimicrobial peptide transport system permease subunit